MEIIIGRYDKVLKHCGRLFGREAFIFALSYAGANEPFRELARFVWESRHRTRYRNHYSGNAVIDVTAWVGEKPNEHFEAFLYYLKDNEDRMTCALISQNVLGSELRAAIERLFDVGVTDLTEADAAVRRPRRIGFSTDDPGEVDADV